jgi:hypothetical protein
MKTIIKPYTTRIRAALAARGLLHEKETLVLAFTDGRTEHISQMDYSEAERLLQYINYLNKPASATPQNNPAADRMRKKILAHCHQMGWYVRNEQGQLVLKNGKPQLDFGRIDHFCTGRGKFKKPLQRHTPAELRTLLYQFEMLLKSEIKKS